MIITERSTKADIIDAALELTASQEDQILQLKQRQTILWALVIILTILHLF